MRDDDKTCQDCHIALRADAPLTDGLCRHCHTDLTRTLARLDRLEDEYLR
jgi:hypothetical protein